MNDSEQVTLMRRKRTRVTFAGGDGKQAGEAVQVYTSIVEGTAAERPELERPTPPTQKVPKLMPHKCRRCGRDYFEATVE